MTFGVLTLLFLLSVVGELVRVERATPVSDAGGSTKNLELRLVDTSENVVRERAKIGGHVLVSPNGALWDVSPGGKGHVVIHVAKDGAPLVIHLADLANGAGVLAILFAIVCLVFIYVPEDDEPNPVGGTARPGAESSAA